MADQISIPKLVQKSKLYDDGMNPRLSLKLWLDDYDSDKGTQISISNIAEFVLRESMFLKLPFGTFTYVDDGTAKLYNEFYNGRTLYVWFEYSSSDDSSDKNISSGRYRILGTKMVATGRGSIMYLVTFVCDAMALLNSVPKFPDNSSEYPCTSVEALRSVCSYCGVPLSSNVETTDQMSWFNPSMPAHRFVQYIVNHSYLGDDDFGMFWVDKCGNAHFNGIRATLESETSYYFDSDVNNSLQSTLKRVIYSDVFSTDSQELSEAELKSKYENRLYILMTEDQRNDEGWVSDFYGNSVEVGTYDPMGRSALYKSEDMKMDWAHMTHKITGKQILNGVPSTDVTDRERVRKSNFAGYASVDFAHAAWDFAPEQNSIMRSEFFDNRHTIKINTGKQLRRFGDQELRIGDILYIDFDTKERDLSVDNGKYIVHSIEWRFKRGSDLYQFIRVASDSLHPTDR